MGSCYVPLCGNKRRRHRHPNAINFYCLPKNKTRRDLWLRSIFGSTRDSERTDHKRVCEVHFDASQFESHRADGWRKLKPNAVPTIFPKSPGKSDAANMSNCDTTSSRRSHTGATGVSLLDARRKNRQSAAAAGTQPRQPLVLRIHPDGSSPAIEIECYEDEVAGKWKADNLGEVKPKRQKVDDSAKNGLNIKEEEVVCEPLTVADDESEMQTVVNTSSQGAVASTSESGVQSNTRSSKNPPSSRKEKMKMAAPVALQLIPIVTCDRVAPVPHDCNMLRNSRFLPCKYDTGLTKFSTIADIRDYMRLHRFNEWHVFTKEEGDGGSAEAGIVLFHVKMSKKRGQSDSVGDANGGGNIDVNADVNVNVDVNVNADVNASDDVNAGGVNSLWDAVEEMTRPLEIGVQVHISPGNLLPIIRTESRMLRLPTELCAPLEYNYCLWRLLQYAASLTHCPGQPVTSDIRIYLTLLGHKKFDGNATFQLESGGFVCFRDNRVWSSDCSMYMKSEARRGRPKADEPMPCCEDCNYSYSVLCRQMKNNWCQGRKVHHEKASAAENKPPRMDALPEIQELCRALSTLDYREARSCLWTRCGQNFSSGQDLMLHIRRQHAVAELAIVEATSDDCPVVACPWQGCDKFFRKTAHDSDIIYAHINCDHVFASPRSRIIRRLTDAVSIASQHKIRGHRWSLDSIRDALDMFYSLTTNMYEKVREVSFFSLPSLRQVVDYRKVLRLPRKFGAMPMEDIWTFRADHDNANGAPANDSGQKKAKYIKVKRSKLPAVPKAKSKRPNLIDNLPNLLRVQNRVRVSLEKKLERVRMREKKREALRVDAKKWRATQAPRRLNPDTDKRFKENKSKSAASVLPKSNGALLGNAVVKIMPKTITSPIQRTTAAGSNRSLLTNVSGQRRTVAKSQTNGNMMVTINQPSAADGGNFRETSIPDTAITPNEVYRRVEDKNSIVQQVSARASRDVVPAVTGCATSRDETRMRAVEVAAPTGKIFHLYIPPQRQPEHNYHLGMPLK